MGFIIQTQRRAIERLKPQADRLQEWPFAIFKKDIRFSFTDGQYQKIFLCGISEGYGTCSDIHGMNVAVFSDEKPSRIIWGGPKLLWSCSYGVFLYEAEEVDNYYEQAVELLRPLGWSVCKDGRSAVITFEKTGHKAGYIPVL